MVCFDGLDLLILNFFDIIVSLEPTLGFVDPTMENRLFKPSTMIGSIGDTSRARNDWNLGYEIPVLTHLRTFDTGLVQSMTVSLLVKETLCTRLDK